MNKFKVKTMEQEHMKSAKLHCLALMTKFIFKTMDMTDQLLNIRVNQKNKTVVFKTI